MKKLFVLICCSLFLFVGCGTTSYLQTVEADVSIEDSSTSEDDSEILTADTIYVQVAGAVTRPGVYELLPEARVFEAIEAAGGLLDTADDSDLNQAEILEDGEKIYIYSIDEKRAIEAAALDEAEVDDGLININTADVTELMTLPGIGEAKANQIIAYRTTSGEFTSIEDIKNVSGIGDGIYAQIQSYIKV